MRRLELALRNERCPAGVVHAKLVTAHAARKLPWPPGRALGGPFIDEAQALQGQGLIPLGPAFRDLPVATPDADGSCQAIRLRFSSVGTSCCGSGIPRRPMHGDVLSNRHEVVQDDV